jgi:hypothetical protein
MPEGDSISNPLLDLIRSRKIRAIFPETSVPRAAIERREPGLGDGASLVRLQSADEVPRDVEMFEFRHLRQSLLDVAFAEVAQALYDAAHMTADEKRSRMRLLRQIVKDHNVHRWIRSFLEAIPSLDQVKGGSGSSSWPEPSGATVASSFASPFGSAVRVDQKMPGVALLASGIAPGRRSRYAMKEAKLRFIGTAVGED